MSAFSSVVHINNDIPTDVSIFLLVYDIGTPTAVASGFLVIAALSAILLLYQDKLPLSLLLLSLLSSL